MNLRRAAIFLLVTVGVIAVVFGTIMVYVRDTVVDSNEAAKRAVDALGLSGSAGVDQREGG